MTGWRLLLVLLVQADGVAHTEAPLRSLAGALARGAHCQVRMRRLGDVSKAEGVAALMRHGGFHVVFTPTRTGDPGCPAVVGFVQPHVSGVDPVNAVLGPGPHTGIIRGASWKVAEAYDARVDV